MSDPLVAIANLLSAEGVASTIVLNNTPPSPDNILVIRATGGIYDRNNIAHPYDKFTFQLECRAANMQTAYNTLAAAYSVLQNKGGEIGGIWFVEIIGLQPFPTYLMKDSQNRHMYTQNYRAEIRNDTDNRYM